MPYIGTSPSNGVRRKHTYTATASQTSFSGAGAEGATLSYTDSNFVDVYQNGVKLSEADYTSTSGTAIVLATGATVSDMIEVVVYDVFSVADTVSKSAGGTFDGNITAAGTITVTGNADLNGDLDVDGTTNLDVVDIDGALTQDGGAVFNEASADVDFRVESNADANCLFVEGETSNVCINVATGNSSNNGSLTIGHSGITKITGAANGNADELILIGANASANVGMSIISNNANQGIIYFGDEDDTDIGGIIYDHSANFLAFQTNTAERMRLGVGLGLGTDATYAKLMINQDTQALNMITLFNTNSTHGGNFVSFLRSTGVAIGSINQNSAAGIVYNTSSDYRLKENVSYSFDATTRLKQLKPARFNWISDDTNTLQDGFLAHEVSSIVPEAITGSKDATKTEQGIVKDASGNIIAQNITETIWETGKEEETYAGNTTWSAEATVPDYQQIDHSKLVPLLTKTILELEARITALESA